MEIFFPVLASNTAFAVSWRIARKPWGSFMLLLCTWFAQAAQLSIFYFRKIREVTHCPETCLRTGTLFWEIGLGKESSKKKIQHLAEFEPTTSLITMRVLYCCATTSHPLKAFWKLAATCWVSLLPLFDWLVSTSFVLYRLLLHFRRQDTSRPRQKQD